MIRIRRTECQMMLDRGFDLDDDDKKDAYAPNVPDKKYLREFLMRLKVRMLEYKLSAIISALDKIYVRGDKRWIIIHSLEADNTTREVPLDSMRNLASSVTDTRQLHFLLKTKQGVPENLVQASGTPALLDGAIFVTGVKISSKAKEIVDKIKSLLDVQSFTIAELLYNPTQHFLTPNYKHVYNPDEINKFLKYRKLVPNNLPRILASDPISRYYGAKVGDLFMETVESILPAISSKQTIWRIVR